MDRAAAEELPDTPQSRELVTSRYGTNELAHQLHTSLYGSDAGRAGADQFWAEYCGLLWDRGLICRALAHLGTNLRLINFRKS
jgi:hypothetical protein